MPFTKSPVQALVRQVDRRDRSSTPISGRRTAERVRTAGRSRCGRHTDHRRVPAEAAASARRRASKAGPRIRRPPARRAGDARSPSPRSADRPSASSPAAGGRPRSYPAPCAASRARAGIPDLRSPSPGAVAPRARSRSAKAASRAVPRPSQPFSPTALSRLSSRPSRRTGLRRTGARACGAAASSRSAHAFVEPRDREPAVLGLEPAISSSGFRTASRTGPPRSRCGWAASGGAPRRPPGGPAQLVGEGGMSDIEVAGVREHRHVRGQQEAWRARNGSRPAEPVSSSPSIRKRTFSGSRPTARDQASTAAIWRTKVPLSSTVPRRTAGRRLPPAAKAGVVQRSQSQPLHVVVVRRRAASARLPRAASRRRRTGAGRASRGARSESGLAQQRRRSLGGRRSSSRGKPSADARGAPELRRGAPSCASTSDFDVPECRLDGGVWHRSLRGRVPTGLRGVLTMPRRKSRAAHRVRMRRCPVKAPLREP